MTREPVGEVVDATIKDVDSLPPPHACTSWKSGAGMATPAILKACVI